MNALADEIGKLIPKQVTCVASSGYGGLPLGSVVASRFNYKFSAVRGFEKDYGNRGMIDGHVPDDNDLVVIIDDVLTSGSSINETLRELEKTGTKIDRAIVAVKRSDLNLSVPYSYVFSINEILD